MFINIFRGILLLSVTAFILFCYSSVLASIIATLLGLLAFKAFADANKSRKS